jgi:cytochrome c oxidase subunit II
MRIGLRSIAAFLLAAILTGCNDWQSALHPAAPQSDEIHSLFLIFLAVAAFVWTAVMLALLIGLIRRRPAHEHPLQTNAISERAAAHTIFGFSLVTIATVLALSVLSYLAQRTVFAKSPNNPVIRVIGHQWWWEVKYEGDPAQTFTTANEIRIPVGQPVSIKLETRDVIHSFWVPSLSGKMDQINNQENDLQLTATKPGVYRGQCAEFCGMQHAHMGFEVVAMRRDQYDDWRTNQLKSAQPPQEPELQKGELVFRGRGCAVCHTISGTPAGGKLGPDLTHLASRRTIAAATLPLTPGNLAGWISDPQHIKPGNRMPPVQLAGQELSALVSYLGSLQ